MKNFFFFGYISILMFIVSSIANAGQGSSVFSESVFGVCWNDSIETIQQKIPGGKTNGVLSDLVKHYAVEDGREVLRIKRRAKDKITFSFSDSRLTTIGIEFKPSSDNYGALLNQLSSYLGAYEIDPNAEDIGAIIVRWPVDNGISVRLVYYQSGIIGSSIILEISDTRPIPLDKNSMGF